MAAVSQAHSSLRAPRVSSASFPLPSQSHAPRHKSAHLILLHENSSMAPYCLPGKAKLLSRHMRPSEVWPLPLSFRSWPAVPNPPWPCFLPDAPLCRAAGRPQRSHASMLCAFLSFPQDTSIILAPTPPDLQFHAAPPCHPLPLLSASSSAPHTAVRYSPRDTLRHTSVPLPRMFPPSLTARHTTFKSCAQGHGPGSHAASAG